MKKSVIITIGVIYVLAIVIVGFVGMRLKVSSPEIYVEEIICESDGYAPNTSTEPDLQKYSGFIFKKYQEGLKVEIRCRVFPENASNSKLEFTYDDTKVNSYKIIEGDNGTITIEFLKKTSVDIIVTSTDTKKKQIIIQVTAY